MLRPTVGHMSSDLSEEDSIVQTLVRSCPRLEKLTLSSENITDNCMIQLSHLSQLKRFTLKQSSLVTKTGLRRFLEAGGKLESLTFSHVQAFSTHDIDSLLDHPYSSIAINCKHLKVLEITTNTVFGDLSAALLETVLASCVNLEELRIQNIYKRDWTYRDRILIALIAHCPNVVCIKLPGFFSEAALLDLFRTYPRLTELSLHPLSDSSIQALNLHCPPLKRFLTNRAMTDATLCKFFESHPNLVALPVIYSKAALVSLARNCPKLKRLSLALSRVDFGNTVYKATETCRNLVSMTISLRTMLSVSEASVLGNSCRRVRRLRLYSDKMSASGIVALIQQTRRLNVLTIKCSNQTVWEDLVTLLKCRPYFKRRLCIHFAISPTAKYKVELPELIVTNEITNEVVQHQKQNMYGPYIAASLFVMLSVFMYTKGGHI